MNPPIARQLNLDETKLPAEIFERLSRRGATLKDYRRRREEAIENFGKPGRDPAELGSVMTTIAGNGVWAANMKLGAIAQPLGPSGGTGHRQPFGSRRFHGRRTDHPCRIHGLGHAADLPYPPTYRYHPSQSQRIDHRRDSRDRTGRRIHAQMGSAAVAKIPNKFAEASLWRSSG